MIKLSHVLIDFNKKVNRIPKISTALFIKNEIWYFFMQFGRIIAGKRGCYGRIFEIFKS